MAEQEKSLIWMMRYEIRDKYDYALPLLLNAVKWDNHIDVSKVRARELCVKSRKCLDNIFCTSKC